jgi:hypothetical protein
MFAALWLALLAVAATADATRICSAQKPYYCVGYSGKPKDFTPLQLKNPYELENRTSVTEWDIGNFSQVVNRTLFYMVSENRLALASSAQLYRKRVNTLYMNGSYVRINGTSRCLTIMECNSEGRDFCRPSTNRARYSYQINKGSYLAFTRCGASFSQEFVLDPWCGPFCSPADLLSPSCMPGCARARYCNYNITEKCPNTTSPTASHPTRQPSKQPTGLPISYTPTLHPVTAPTAQPGGGGGGTDSPTPQPSLTSSKPSAQPSAVGAPNGRPTNQPSKQPTGSQAPSNPPSRSPVAAPVFSTAPTTPAVHVVNGEALGIGLAFGAVILISWAVIVFLLYERSQRNGGRGTANQPADTLNR